MKAGLFLLCLLALDSCIQIKRNKKNKKSYPVQEMFLGQPPSMTGGEAYPVQEMFLGQPPSMTGGEAYPVQEMFLGQPPTMMEGEGMFLKPRKLILGAHWKMNKGYEEGINWIKDAADKVPSNDRVETIVFPQYPLIKEAVENQGENLRIGVQNVHLEDSGSYTGEVSAKLIAEIGGRFSLVGHSERYKMYGETHEDCNKKILQLLKYDITPILDIGEEIKDGDDEEKTKDIIRNELDIELKDVSKEDAKKLILSFEPAAAVGTGLGAAEDEAEKYCKFIRDYIEEKFGNEVAKDIRILYSGSTSPENFKNYLMQPDIDGAIVGKKGLDLDNFLKMAEIAGEFR